MAGAQPVAETRRARPPGMALSRPGVGLPLAAGAGAAARAQSRRRAGHCHRGAALANLGGLRVPAVVAVSKQAFVMRDLGQAGQPVQSLGHALEQAGTAAATLALWQRGLQALAQVHGQGQCLSQAFARNMVLCADGGIGLIDFEDDPAAHLPLPLCQVRDVLCYVHSTAWILARVQALPQAQVAWQQALAQWSPPVQQALAATQQRLGLLGKLPRSRRLGRDALRLRMAWALLAGNNV